MSSVLLDTSNWPVLQSIAPLCALHSVTSVGGHSALRGTVCTRAECTGGTLCPRARCPGGHSARGGRPALRYRTMQPDGLLRGHKNAMLFLNTLEVSVQRLLQLHVSHTDKIKPLIPKISPMWLIPTPSHFLAGLGHTSLTTSFRSKEVIVWLARHKTFYHMHACAVCQCSEIF